MRATALTVAAPPGAGEPEPVAPLRPARAAPAAIVAAAVMALVLAEGGDSAWSVASAATAGILVWLAAIDLEVRLVPNRIVLPVTASLLALALALDVTTGLGHAAAALATGAALLVAALARPGGLGMGDVKLGALLGALLGSAVLTAVVVGFALSAVVGLGLVARRGRSALQDQLPMAPFLAAGAIVALLLG